MYGYFFDKPIHTSLVQITPPSEEPVSLDEAKAWARIEYDTDDDLVSSLIVAARRRCEAWLNRAFITQTWKFNLDSFPWLHAWNLLGPHIDLPLPPLQSVTQIQYFDPSDELQTLDPSLYIVDFNSQPARIIRQYNYQFPISRWRSDAVQITMVVGYGDCSAVPETIKTAIKAIVAGLYEQREHISEGSLVEVPLAAKWLLNAEDPYIYR